MSTSNDSPLLAQIDLWNVRSAGDLAFLQAHFDCASLVGINGTGELLKTMSDEHPSAPVPLTPGNLRITITCTLVDAARASMHSLYDSLELAAPVLRIPQNMWGTSAGISSVEDGWCRISHESVALAASTDGQVRLSKLITRDEVVDFDHFILLAAQFNRCAALLHQRAWPDSVPETRLGLLVEGLEGTGLMVPSILAPDGNVPWTNFGNSPADFISLDGFLWRMDGAGQEVITTLLADFALHYAYQGKRVRFDNTKLSSWLRKQR